MNIAFVNYVKKNACSLWILFNKRKIGNIFPRVPMNLFCQESLHTSENRIHTSLNF